jgi:molybdopterin-guanine dinucleotide biosynthesis protein A
LTDVSSPDSHDRILKIEHVTGIVPAGGGSRRMGGEPKALLKVGGVTIIERVVSVLRAVFTHVCVVADDKDSYSFLDIPIYADIMPGIGALGGVHTGLMTCSTDYAFFAACDMPFLDANAIRQLVSLAPGHDVVIPVIDERFEPLHAVYSRNCIPHIETIIESGGSKILDLLPGVDVYEVGISWLEAISSDLRFLMNVNTPEDLRKARIIAETFERDK